MEKTPMSRSHEGQGRVVFEYEPIVGNFVSVYLTPISAIMLL